MPVISSLPLVAFAHSAICAMTWLVNEFDITKRRVAGGAAEVHEAAAREQRDALAVREDELIDLRLDVLFLDLLVVLEPGDLDLAVEVADVAEDGLVLHRLHVLAA